jgi:hypothetical protein
MNKSLQRKASSGLILSENLSQAFRSASMSINNVRYLTVTVHEDVVDLVRTVHKASNRWHADFNIVSQEFKENEPLFVIFMKDYATEERQVFLGNHEHDHLHGNVKCSKVILMLYIPDSASARDRMHFGSAWSLLRELCGTSLEEYQGSSKDDFTYKCYTSMREHLQLDKDQQGKVSVSELVSSDHKGARGLNVLAMATGGGAMPQVVLESIRKASKEAKEGKGGLVGGVTHERLTKPSQINN